MTSMAGPSPRYLAEHFLMPQFLADRGANAVLSAIDQKNVDFFQPVWMDAGFRFSPAFLYATQAPYRIGILTFPQPQDVTEAYLGAVLGRTDDPSFLRYFLWEESISFTPGQTATVIGEWTETEHANYGPGPVFTGSLQNDAWEFAKRILAIVSGTG
jgi:hypothetical protein